MSLCIFREINRFYGGPPPTCHFMSIPLTMPKQWYWMYTYVNVYIWASMVGQLPHILCWREWRLLNKWINMVVLLYQLQLLHWTFPSKSHLSWMSDQFTVKLVAKIFSDYIYSIVWCMYWIAISYMYRTTAAAYCRLHRFLYLIKVNNECI